MDAIAKLKNKLKIAVIGDAMIDVYYSGHVSRVSPEFPVQVLHSPIDIPDYLPGGAANVCYQMKHFNVECSLVSFLDKEAYRLLSKHNLDTLYCVDLGQEQQIPRKIRFYDNDFPLLRWDIEQTYSGNNNVLLQQLSYLFQRGIDVAILSDYNKGVFTSSILTSQIIELCKKHNIPTLVDPKAKPVEKWKGCTVFKPNSAEAELLTGEKYWKRQAEVLTKQLSCKGIVITQQGKGVVGICDGEFFEYYTNYQLGPKEVNSVIGAGDCFAAVLAMGIGNNINLKDACVLAFEGGIEYVKARHNRPITLYDIRKRLDSVNAKLIDLEELIYLREHFPENWVWTNGCFDILHSGHLETLKFAKKQGTHLVVGVNSDESIKRLKGQSRPIIDLQERMKMLSALEYVDFVVSFEENTPYELIKKLKPDIIVKGGEYQEEKIVGHDLAKVVLAPYKDGISTSSIIDKICRI